MTAMAGIVPHFLANWKMNMRREEARGFCEQFRVLLPTGAPGFVGIAPPLTALGDVVEALRGAPFEIGAQNVHWLESGAHTAEVSAPMLTDWGVKFAIVGHSERRQFYGETDDKVALRAKAAIAAGMLAVVCVGESESDFRAERTREIVAAQLRGSLAGIAEADLPRLVIAYEPVWAIGTGLAATPQIAADVHGFIRSELRRPFATAADQIPILYGGSTSPGNIREIMSSPEVNGALVGGASLKAESFAKLITEGLAAKSQSISEPA